MQSRPEVRPQAGCARCAQDRECVVHFGRVVLVPIAGGHGRIAIVYLHEQLVEDRERARVLEKGGQHLPLEIDW